VSTATPQVISIILNPKRGAPVKLRGADLFGEDHNKDGIASVLDCRAAKGPKKTQKATKRGKKRT
jgi:hypothetical protein